jgi:hypothetical protein
MKTSVHFLSYLTQFFLEWEMVRTKVVEKVKTQILYFLFYFIFLIHALYEIMCKNIAEVDRPQMTIRRMWFCMIDT